METANHGKRIPIAGFVRGKKQTRDGNFRFRILHQWFSIPSGSTFAKIVQDKKTERAIVVYEPTDKKYPRIISVKENYTGKELRDVTIFNTKGVTKIL